MPSMQNGTNFRQLSRIFSFFDSFVILPVRIHIIFHKQKQTTTTMPNANYQVDFSTLDVSALRRYCRLNHLKPKSKTREALVTAATTHWNSTSAQEVDSVAYFLFAVKHRRKF